MSLNDPPAARVVDAVDEVDEDELDLKWGFTPSEPLVGFGAPPVVAVMITSDPGEWFEETLESLADQDYESLSVLVIDNDGSEDPTERIADVLPTAFVKRLDADQGFSSAANEVLTTVEGAAFYLFMHDDVRLDPSTVTKMVSEGFRSNAGIVGPKFVEWDDPSRLASVGYAVDPYGFASSLSEVGELDQSQHDTAREVFAVSDACMLVRSDLFATLGGFEERVPYFGEDMDLCWRAHVAAASVHFCPAAVVAHRGEFERRRPTPDRERIELRHEARSMIANYEPFRLLRVLPAAIALSVVDLVGSLVLGRFQRAADIVASWGWNLANVTSLFRSRSRVKRHRRAHDSEYLPLMRQGSSRLSELTRVDDGEGRFQAAASAGRGYVQKLTSESNRAGVALAVVATLLVLVGARDLLAGPLPVLREFVATGPDAGGLLAQWWSGWREAGFGESSPPPNVVPGLGVVGTLLFGSVGLARRLLIVAPLLLGALGAWKLFADTDSLRARAAALAAYGLNPIALNAMAEGRLQALVTYAAAPWLLRRVARLSSTEPFLAPAAGATRRRQFAGTALLLCAVAAVTPLGALLLVASVLVLMAVQAASGRRVDAATMGVALGGGVLFSLPLVAPWILTAALRGDAASLSGMWNGRGSAPSAAEILTGDVGTVSVGLFGWGLLVAAAYALTSGRSWRFRWALGGWVLAICSWVGTIVLARTDAVAGAGVELTLVPAALGLTLSVAMGAFAFERDVIGSDFGLSQLLSGLAVLALGCSLIPIAVASTDGRWYLPEGDYARVLDFVDDGTDFRSVWIGDPDVLPMAGWELDSLPGLAVGLTTGLDPTVTQRYRLDGGAGVEELSSAIDAAMRGETSRLGRVLAPMGVRYVITVDRPAPQPFSPLEVPIPVGAVAALQEQLDLAEIEANPAMKLFEVDQAWPLRSDITDSELPDTELGTSDLLQLPLEAPPAALGRAPGTGFDGPLRADRRVAQSVPADPDWSLTVEGEQAERSELFGWQQQFVTSGAGDATLRFDTPLVTRAWQLLQLVGLVFLLLSVRRRGSLVPGRLRSHDTDEDPLVVLTPHGAVLSAELDVSGGTATRAQPGGTAEPERTTEPT